MEKEQKAKEIEQKMKEELAHSEEVCKVHNQTQMVEKVANKTIEKQGNGSLDDPIEQEQLKSLVDQDLSVKVKDIVTSDLSGQYNQWNLKSKKQKSERHFMFQKQMSGYMQQMLLQQQS